MSETVAVNVSAGVWGWETRLLSATCLQSQCSLSVLCVTVFIRYTWLGPWSQISRLSPDPGKGDGLKSYLSNVGGPSVDGESVR